MAAAAYFASPVSYMRKSRHKIDFVVKVIEFLQLLPTVAAK
jgi:hypothetical protein